MSPIEYKQLQLAASSTAARSLMLWSAKLLQKSLPSDPALRAECLAALDRKLATARADYLVMTFPELPAAVSDMWAGEAQDAFDALAKEFQATLASGET